MAVNWIVSRVEVQDDPIRRINMSLKEQLDEELLDGPCVTSDFLVPAPLVGADWTQFQAVERALAGQSLTLVSLPDSRLTGRIHLSHDSCQQGIAPQIIMVIEVFIAQSQGVNPLSDEMLKRVLDEFRVTVVSEAGGKLTDDGGDFLGLAEQQAAAVRGDVAAVERRENLTSSQDGEIQVDCVGLIDWDDRPRCSRSLALASLRDRFAGRVGITLCHCREP